MMLDLDQFPPHLKIKIAALGDDPEFEEIQAALSTPIDERGLSRRRFLQGAAATGGAAAVGFGPLSNVAAAMEPLGEGDPILIVVQMGGGNDGLNTVVPVGDPAYRQLRRATSVANGAIPLGEGGLALHPALPRLAARYGQRKVAIVRGVGNPDIDRSHFSSVATWMAGTSGTDRTSGWLGRYLDTLPDSPEGLRGVTLDSSVPLHLFGRRSEVSSLGPLGPFGSDRTSSAEAALFTALRGMGADSTLGAMGLAVGLTNRRAIDHARLFEPAYVGSTGSSDASLVAQMQRAAAVINANLGVRVFGVSLGSFDTHSNQLWQHQNLLEDFDAAIDAFYAGLDATWRDQVLIMTFSEFGRRAAENGSGTDHGTAAPVLVIGDRVRGGLHGTQPSLTELDSIGDPAVTVDFRSVYASMLEGWLGVDSVPILGRSYPELSLVGSRPQAKPKPKPAGKGRYAPFADAGGFVTQQYLDFRGVRPTPGNRSLWIRRVNGRSYTLTRTLETFFVGSMFYTPGIPINRMSLNLLGRPADYDDLVRWCALDRAQGRRAVVVEMVTDPAFRARYSRIWSSDLVNRLHSDLTGKAPTSGVRTTWTNAVHRNVNDGAIDMIVAISETSDGKRRRRNEALAASVQNGLLRRAPTTASYQAWAAKLDAGTSMGSMLYSVFRSNSYRARFA
jgi:uncharacterized protein (DUF1501 family)